MDGTSRTFASSYDPASNRTGLSKSDYNVSFTYNPAGQMTGVLETGAPYSYVQFGYDSQGRRSSLDMGPSSTTSLVGYGYDALSRLSAINRDLAGSVADQNATFAYNPASQIVTRTNTNDAFASNSALNVTRDYARNGLNQYTMTTSNGSQVANFAYDANGNLTSDGSTGFVYDAENRLVSASGLKNASLAYDPLGRLWQTSGGSAGTTRFVYDGDKLVEEYDGAGNRLRLYVHGAGADAPVVWYDVTGGPVRRYLHADQQGSIVTVADDYGTPLAINGYDSWGIPNAANLGRFQYTGQTWIPELGMYYYKARFYSPTLGRFMQTDPIGYKDQINLYAYVGNDPMNRTDPTGLADLNLVRPSDTLYDEAQLADFPGAFTIFAHSNVGGVEDQRGPGNAPVLNVYQLLREAEKAGYERGTLTFLMSCTVGSSELTNTTRNYAQQYADLSGGRVIASPGVVSGRNLGNGRVRLTAKMGLYASDPNKSGSVAYIGNRLYYNKITGIGTVVTEKIGTRIQTKTKICLRDTCENN